MCLPSPHGSPPMLVAATCPLPWPTQQAGLPFCGSNCLEHISYETAFRGHTHTKPFEEFPFRHVYCWELLKCPGSCISICFAEGVATALNNNSELRTSQM